MFENSMEHYSKRYATFRSSLAFVVPEGGGIERDRGEIDERPGKIVY